ALAEVTPGSGFNGLLTGAILGTATAGAGGLASASTVFPAASALFGWFSGALAETTACDRPASDAGAASLGATFDVFSAGASSALEATASGLRLSVAPR